MGDERGSLFRKRRLGRRRDLLQHDVLLVLVDTELDDRIPVFAGDVVLVHALDDFIDGRLRWGEINDARKEQNLPIHRLQAVSRYGGTALEYKTVVSLSCHPIP